MEKYRIVTYSKQDLSKMTFHIEVKERFGLFFSWTLLTRKEGKNENNLEFESFEEARDYLLNQFCKFTGTIYCPYPNEFHYNRYYQG